MPQLSLHSPIGDLTIVQHGNFIVSIEWGWGEAQTDTPLLLHACTQLQRYFEGRLTQFDLPLAPAGTLYQRAVWQALYTIPYGETRTYGQIANQAGGSARSVGQANGRNPIPVIIPCHRVVAAGSLGGYSGRGGLASKTWLLERENVAFTKRAA